jgi:pimeloyl-ACP methyl ester carboxylesterase
MNASKTMVTLVHGTWAKNAPWTHPDSPLSRALGARGYEVRAASWEAGNRFTHRRKGAELLRRHLEDHPEYDHVLVGHSHGGNVALRAIDGDESRVKGLVCLNTPFLNVLGRHLEVFRAIGTTLGVAVSLIPVGLGLKHGFDVLLLVYYVLTALVIGVAGVWFAPVGRWMVARGQSFQSKPLEQTPVYCLNTPDDEAYGALSFLASLQNVLFFAVHPKLFLSRFMGVLIALLVLVEALPFLYVPWDLWTGDLLYTREVLDEASGGAASGGAAASGSVSPWRLLIVPGVLFLFYLLSSTYLFALYALSVLTLLLVVSVLVSASQGRFAPFSGLFHRFLVTLVPLRCVDTRFEELGGDNADLQHSALYNDDTAITKVVDWIDALDPPPEAR